MSYSEQTKQIWKNLKLFLNIKVLFKIDVSFKTAGRFIDLETFIKDEDDASFVKMTIKNRIPFLKIPEVVKHYAIALYMIESSEMKERFVWIYRPPSFPQVGEITQGSMERENFVKYYSTYMELVYLCVTQMNEKLEDILEGRKFLGITIKRPWETKKFLFIGEYLLRKRIVENLK